MENNSTSTPSRLSPALWPSNAFGILPSVGVGAGIVALIFVSFLILYGIASSAGFEVHMGKGVTPKPNETVLLFLLQDLSYIPVIGFIFYIMPRLAKRTLAELGIGKPKWGDIQAGVLGVVPIWLAVAAVSFLFDMLTHKAHHQEELKLFDNLNAMQTFVAVVTAVFLAPFFEEVVFRLFLFNTLLKHMPVMLAILLNGLLFGFAHGQKDIVPPLAVCGMGLAAIYYRTGSLWTNVIAHACFNGITTIFVFVFHYKG